MTTVLLVDDEPMVCAHLRTILGSAPDLEVVGAVHDGAAALEATVRLRPDVVLMDLRMPGVDGLSALRAITAHAVASRVVVLTAMDTDDLMSRAVLAGASGFLVKSTPAEDLIELVRVAARGHAVVSPQSLARLAERGRSADPATLARLGSLTDREAEVLQHLGVGASNARIARALSLSEATVKGHVSRILVKLDCENRSQAALAARSVGHARPGGPGGGAGQAVVVRSRPR